MPLVIGWEAFGLSDSQFDSQTGQLTRILDQLTRFCIGLIWLGRSSFTKRIVYAVRGLLLERQVDVAIDIHCDADAAVAEDFHDYTWANPLHQKKCCAGVSRVVEALVTNARFFDSADE